MEFIIDFLRIVFVGLDIDIYHILKDDDYVTTDRAIGHVKNRVWFLLIAVPLILSAIAVFMKTALIWKILLFIPSVSAFIFFFRKWWRNMTGE